MESFGIRVTIAVLGGFATDWAWSSMKFSPLAPEYDELRQSIFGIKQLPWDMSKQAPDPSEGEVLLWILAVFCLIAILGGAIVAALWWLGSLSL